MSDAVVVGAGLAGLTAAIRLAKSGRSVAHLSAGVGGLQLSQGTIDLLGYCPERVMRPLDAIEALAAANHLHPYHHLRADGVRHAAEWFAAILGPTWLTGSTEVNAHMPTAVGALRPTALMPPSMAAGDLREGTHVAIVGLRHLKDMYPALIADNVARTDLPTGGRASARAVTIDFPVREGEADSSGLVTARAVDDAATLTRLADSVARELNDADQVVGMPAVLGLRDAHATWSAFQTRLGRPVFEIPLPPPSVPGLRMNAALTEIARAAGVRLMMGARAVNATRKGDRITGVQTDTAGRLRLTRSPWIVFAPGGFESGAIAVDSYGAISEPVFGLPLAAVPSDPMVLPDYWADHPLFHTGAAVDQGMRPVDAHGVAPLDNVVVAGGIVAGASRWREKSGEGIAIATAVRAVDTIIEDAS